MLTNEPRKWIKALYTGENRKVMFNCEESDWKNLRFTKDQKWFLRVYLNKLLRLLWCLPTGICG